MSNKRGEAGLTMIEILVVILIMGILAGILVPALSAAKRKARQTTCASNMRQMGLAFGMYAVDWRNKLPHEDNSIPSKTAVECGRTLPALCTSGDCPYNWFFALDEYLTAKSEDRAAKIKQDPVYAAVVTEKKETTRTIKINSGFEPDSNCNPRFRSLATISEPNKTVLLFDGRINNVSVAANFSGSSGSIDNRHSGGANFLFVNNRVQWYGEDNQADFVWSP